MIFIEDIFVCCQLYYRPEYCCIHIVVHQRALAEQRDAVQEPLYHLTKVTVYCFNFD